MARKRKGSRRRRTRYKSAFNIKNAAFGYMGLSILTRGIVGMGPVDFVTAGYGPDGVSFLGTGMSGWGETGDRHHHMITLKEMLSGSQTSGPSIREALQTNLMANWLPMAGGFIGLKVANNS